MSLWYENYMILITRDKEVILNISGFHNHSSSILNEQFREKK